MNGNEGNLLLILILVYHGLATSIVFDLYFLRLVLQTLKSAVEGMLEGYATSLEQVVLYCESNTAEYDPDLSSSFPFLSFLISLFTCLFVAELNGR